MNTPTAVEDRMVRRRMAAMSLIPRWDLARLGAAEVVVVGDGLLVDEVVRALVLLGVGQIGLIEPGDSRYQVAPGGHGVPRAVVRPLPRGLEALIEGRAVLPGSDALVWCGTDCRVRAAARRATERCGIPRIEVQLDVFHGSLSTWLPDQAGSKEEGGGCSPGVHHGPASPAMAAVMGGLAAQETAKVILRDYGYPNLAGRLCLVDGQTYAMRVLETA